MKKEKITVFCGSADGCDPIYTQAALELGQTLAQQGRSLIYGAGNRGLMGSVARSAAEHGGHVTGVNMTRFQNPQYMMSVNENIMTETLQDRKLRMIQMCDACIALPGGIGTMDEIFEVLSMLQLGLTTHPIGLLNVNGFYDVFVQLTEQLILTGFLKEKYAHIIIVRDTVQELLDALDAV